MDSAAILLILFTHDGWNLEEIINDFASKERSLASSHSLTLEGQDSGWLLSYPNSQAELFD